MNVKQAKILLEKINRLFQSMTMDDHVSEIEKELMRNYVKALYEQFSPKSGMSKAEPIQQAPPVVRETPRVVQPPVQQITPPPVQRTITPPPVQQPVQVEKVTPPPAPPVRTVVTPEPPRPEPVVAAPAPIVKPAPAPAPKVEVEKPVARPVTPVRVAPPVVRAPQKPQLNDEQEELFEHKEARELSERLSQSPITDLRKAMGINERILTTNELFDGNGDALKDALSTLNNLKNFEEAKDYLANIADIYDWTARTKKRKAKVFIQLVRRRFS